MPAIAAVVYDRGDAIEGLMVRAVRTLSNNGIHVGGLVEHSQRVPAGTRCAIELEDIATGARYELTQNLGSASRACALDATALAAASSVLRQAIADHVQIVIVNKFGTMEAAGKGLWEEMIQVALAGIPILTTVSRGHLAQWQQLIGTEALLLPVSLSAMLNWCSLVQGVANTHWSAEAVNREDFLSV